MSEEIEVQECAVRGLYYMEGVVDDAAALLREVDAQKWSAVGSSRNSRKVQQYGYRYDYTSYAQPLERIEPIPSFLLPLRDMLHNFCLQLELIDEKYEFNQCIINNYDAGQGIAPHTDHRTFGDVIGCFTLHGGATMDFALDTRHVELYTHPDSLYIMSGDARHTWKHGMTPRKTDTVGNKRTPRKRRISVTFRSVTT